MQINFTGHHIEVTPALKSYTTEKFDKLSHFAERITSIHVTFGVQKLSQVAEANIHISGGDIHASADSNDMYNAIDVLIDKLERQLIKHKEKHTHHHKDRSQLHDD